MWRLRLCAVHREFCEPLSGITYTSAFSAFSAFCVLGSAFCVLRLRSAFCILRSAFCVLRLRSQSHLLCMMEAKRQRYGHVWTWCRVYKGQHKPVILPTHSCGPFHLRPPLHRYFALHDTPHPRCLPCSRMSTSSLPSVRRADRPSKVAYPDDVVDDINPVDLVTDALQYHPDAGVFILVPNDGNVVDFRLSYELGLFSREPLLQDGLNRIVMVLANVPLMIRAMQACGC